MIYPVTIVLLVGRFTGVNNDKVELSKGVCDTSCLNGFIRESDMCSFTCTVTLDEKPKIGTGVRFQIKSKGETAVEDLEHFDLSGECFENYNATYQCRKEEENVFNISYAVRASNNKMVRCKMQNITSNEEWFPQLYDPSEANGVLQVNGLNLFNEEYCNTTIDSNDFFLEFNCHSLATPCVVEIYVKNTVVVFQRKNHVVFNETLTSEANFSVTVKYAACSLDGTYKVIHCRIQKQLIQLNDRLQSDDYLVKIISPVAAFVLIFIISIFIIRRCKKKCNNRPEKAKKDVTKCIQNDDFEGIASYAHGRDGSLSTDPKQSINLLNNELFTKQGSDEIEILQCENGVLTFQESYDYCTNKKDHEGFIDVDDFDIHHLPYGYNDKNFVKLIKSMADLTVFLAVYVGNDNSSSRKLKIGNGFIGYCSVKTEEEDQTCSCNECLLSSTPSKHFANVIVYTSTHIVRNSLEGFSTTCRLFYDNPDSQTFTLKDYKYGTISENQEKFKLNYVTCNPEIIIRLKKATKTWNDLYPKVNSRYKQHADRDKTVIIVSHAHGLHKRISIGKYIVRIDHHSIYEHSNVTQYIYEAPTCVGSTGAYVYVVSRDKKGWLNQHLHFGVSKNGNKLCEKGTDYID